MPSFQRPSRRPVARIVGAVAGGLVLLFVLTTVWPLQQRVQVLAPVWALPPSDSNSSGSSTVAASTSLQVEVESQAAREANTTRLPPPSEPARAQPSPELPSNSPSPSPKPATGRGAASSPAARKPGGSQAAAAAQPAARTPAAATAVPQRLADEVARRCEGTTGSWCGAYLLQQPIAAVPPPVGNRTCLWGCNFVGVCDAMAGWCRCPAGWTGDDCTTRMKRPCSQEQRRHGLEPYNEPTNMAGGGLTLRCGGLCDEDTATCYCPPEYPYGRVPADPQDPPGTPPRRYGRPMVHTCQPNKGANGIPTDFGNRDPDELFDLKKGWCAAERPSIHCDCLQDGLGGEFCDVHHEQFCVNQCNGRGECLHGFCKCHPGWFGQDCAYREAADATEPAGPGLEKERPWIAPHVHTPASASPDPGATRLRPLIYVYELPPMFNQVMLQYRMDKGTCVHRMFDVHNNSQPTDGGWLYATDTALHEMLLQSKHRTLDPEEADFFYMPVYTACLIFPILGAADFPYFHSGPVALRTHSGTNMLIEAFHWVRSHHPYWDRKGGKDHLLLVTHDEGSCWVPAVLRPATILSHWGLTKLDHASRTGYWPDNYTRDSVHPVWQPEGHVGKLGRFACYDPSKDAVLPFFSSPARYQSSPLFGAPPKMRTILGFFRGRIQFDNPAYSQGTRQFLANASAVERWWDKHRIFIKESGDVPGFEGRPYSELMASSVFCFALMGDGYSSRFTDAVLHGCIPVVVQDEVDMELSNIINTAAFSLRIAQADMGRAPEILEAVPVERVRQMQAALAKVWHRYFWGSYLPHRKLVMERLQQLQTEEQQQQGGQGEGGGESQAGGGKEQPQGPPRSAWDWDPGQDDALSTLLQWLYARAQAADGGKGPGMKA